MIIKGKSRSGPAALAAHLLNAETNERVTVLETKGTVARTLDGALTEMDAYAVGTRCEKSLYHAAISPAIPYKLTAEQREEAIDALETKLGLTDHSRVVVLHEKLGRQHIHVVWSRINLETMKAVSDSHNYRKHEEVARDLERRFGHERVQGAHHEREGVKRPDRTPSRSELRQEERTGIKGADVKAEVTALKKISDTPEAFHAALLDAGYTLAKGDRRDFVIVDRKGGIHSLARRLDGIKAAELRDFMAPIDREKLPSALEARKSARELDPWRKEARSEANTEKAFSHGDDYVTQSQAATKQVKKKQKKLNKVANKDSLWDRIEAREKMREQQMKGRAAAKEKDRIARLLDDHDTERRKSVEKSRERKNEDRVAAAFDNVEMTDTQRQRMERAQQSAEANRGKAVDRDDWSPDRQREAPGGGRTRSR